MCTAVSISNQPKPRTPLSKETLMKTTVLLALALFSFASAQTVTTIDSYSPWTQVVYGQTGDADYSETAESVIWTNNYYGGYECTGHFTVSPRSMHQINVNYYTDTITLDVNSYTDTVLMVIDEDGYVQCADDDTYGVDPFLTLYYPQPGTYWVLVGTYDTYNNTSYSLTIEEESENLY